MPPVSRIEKSPLRAHAVTQLFSLSFSSTEAVVVVARRVFFFYNCVIILPGSGIFLTEVEHIFFAII